MIMLHVALQTETKIGEQTLNLLLLLINQLILDYLIKLIKLLKMLQPEVLYWYQCGQRSMYLGSNWFKRCYDKY